ERTGERYALRLAARERCRAPRRERGEAEALDHGFDRPRRPRAAGGVGEVAAHVEMREEPGLLEHRGDAAAVRGNEAPAVLPDLVAEGDAAGAALEAGDDAQERGLSRAARPEDRRDPGQRNRPVDFQRKTGVL